MSVSKSIAMVSVAISSVVTLTAADALGAAYLNPNNVGGEIVGATGYSPAPSDPAVTNSFYYFVGNNPANPSFALYYGAGSNAAITPGLYEVSVSWATGGDRVNPATFKIDYEGGLGSYEYTTGIDQTKLAGGVTTGGANQWSGFQTVGNHLLTSNSAFVWDYSNTPAANYGGVLTAGTIRLTAVPEPAAVAAGAAALLGFALRRRRQSA